jgi:hypothetical protein
VWTGAPNRPILCRRTWSPRCCSRATASPGW